MIGEQDWIVNKIAVLNARLRHETWYNTFWAPYSGFVDISVDDNGNKKYKPTGNPIEILDTHIEEGRDNMLIPFLDELYGERIFGDTTLTGTAESLKMRWLRTYVNQWRKAVMKKQGNMSELRAKIYRLYEEALPALTRYCAKHENQDVFQAFYEGVSPNLSASLSDDGLALDKRYHPNSYYWSGTAITKVAGTEGETPTVDELDTAVSNCDSHQLDTDALKALRITCMKKRIPQIHKEGGSSYWILLVHPQTYSRLSDDGDFKGAQRAAFTGMKKVPEFDVGAAFYSQFVIVEDIVGIRGWDTTNHNFFGSTTQTRQEPTTVTDNMCSLVVGASALGKGIVNALHFTNEVRDHEGIIEIGAAVTNGYNRADFADETQAGEDGSSLFDRGSSGGGIASGIPAINQSSLMLMTDDE